MVWADTHDLNYKCASYTEASRNNDQVKTILGHHLVLQVGLPRTTGTKEEEKEEEGDFRNHNMTEWCFGALL